MKEKRDFLPEEKRNAVGGPNGGEIATKGGAADGGENGVAWGVKGLERGPKTRPCAVD